MGRLRNSAAAAVLVAVSTIFGTSAADAGKLSAEISVIEPRTFALEPRTEDLSERQAKLERSVLEIMKLLHKGKLPELLELKVEKKVENGRTAGVVAQADFGNDYVLTIVSSIGRHNERNMRIDLSTGKGALGNYKSIWTFSNGYGGVWNGAPDGRPVTGEWSQIAASVGTRTTTTVSALLDLLDGMSVPRGSAPKADAFKF